MKEGKKDPKKQACLIQESDLKMGRSLEKLCLAGEKEWGCGKNNFLEKTRNYH